MASSTTPLDSSNPLAPKISAADFATRLEGIARGVARVQGERVPSPNDIREQVSLDIEKQRASLTNELLLIDLRKKYGANIVNFLWWYFAFACIMIVLSSIPQSGFSIPTAVQVALVGGTAVSVIGVVGTVAAGLFRTPK